MTTEAGSQEGRPPSIIDSLVEDTIRMFSSNPLTEDGRPNLLVGAINDSIVKYCETYDRSFIEVGSALMYQNTLPPNEKADLQKIIGDIYPEVSMADRSMEISRTIVFAEIKKRHPEILREDKIRDQQYGRNA